MVRHRLGSARNLLQVSGPRAVRRARVKLAAFIGINNGEILRLGAESRFLLFAHANLRYAAGRNEDEPLASLFSRFYRRSENAAHARHLNGSRACTRGERAYRFRLRNVGHIKEGGKSRWPVCQTDLMAKTIMLDGRSQFYFMFEPLL